MKFNATVVNTVADGTEIFTVDQAGSTSPLGRSFHLALRDRGASTEGCKDWIKSVLISSNQAASDGVVAAAAFDGDLRFTSDPNTRGCSCASREVDLYRVVDGVVQSAGHFAYAAAEGEMVNGELMANRIYVTDALASTLFTEKWNKALSDCPGDAPAGRADNSANPVYDVVGANETKLVINGSAHEEKAYKFRLRLRDSNSNEGCPDWIGDVYTGASKSIVDAGTQDVANENGVQGCSFVSRRTNVWKVESGKAHTKIGTYQYARVKKGTFDFSSSRVFLVDELLLDDQVQTSSDDTWQNGLYNCRKP